MFLISSCSCVCSIHWSKVLSREWRCRWSSTDRRCSNYIWVITILLTTKVLLILEVWWYHLKVNLRHIMHLPGASVSVLFLLHHHLNQCPLFSKRLINLISLYLSHLNQCWLLMRKVQLIHGSNRPWKVLEFDYSLGKCLIFQSALKIDNFPWTMLENYFLWAWKMMPPNLICLCGFNHACCILDF